MPYVFKSVVGYNNRNIGPNTKFIHYKICNFLFISNDVKSNLDDRVRLDYESIERQLRFGILRSFDRGQGGDKGKFLSVNNNIYFTSMDDVHDCLWRLAHGGGIDRMKFWSQVQLGKGTLQSFC